MFWQEQIYSFLLRRILGPLLTRESNQRVDYASLSEGRFVLSDTIVLNAEYLSRFLDGVEIISAEIERLEIQLSLEEKDHGVANSWAWRALQLGHEEATVSLVAKVVVDGLCVHVKACPPKEKAPQREDREEDEKSTQSVLSSYIQAALSTLQLDVQLNNTKIRVVEEQNHWVGLHLQTIAYHDTTVPRQLTKRLDLTRVSLLAGQGDLFVTTALMDGTSRLSVAWNETFEPNKGNEELESSSLIRKDVNITLQKCNVSVDSRSLLYMKHVTQSFLDQRNKQLDEPKMDIAPSWILSTEDDEHDVATIDALVQQYQQARLLVERKEIRGGILVPAADESGLMTFDTFFDANQFTGSALRNTSTPKAATIPSDWVHTKFHFCWMEGGFKVSFASSDNREHSEYILITMAQINIETTISEQSTQHCLTVGHFTIEDSHIVVDDAREGKSIEIGTLLRFIEQESAVEATMVDNDLMDEPALPHCISLSVHSQQKKKVSESIIDLKFQPLELAYYIPTAQKLSELMKCVGGLVKPDPDVARANGQLITEATEPNDHSLKLNVWCSVVEISLPLPSDSCEWIELYRRCGYSSGASLMRKPCLGLTLDQCNFDLTKNGALDLRFQCSSLVAFAGSPVVQNVFDTRTMRYDLFGLCGRNEVEPHIPLEFHYQTDVSRAASKAAFPKVIPISSFKTRQDDDESDFLLERHGSNTESSMLSATLRCKTLVTLNVPEILLDVTSSELRVLSLMASALKLESESDDSDGGGTKTNRQVDPVSLTVFSDFVAVNIRDDQFGSSSFALLALFENFSICCCLEDSSIHHVRLLVDELNLHERKFPLLTFCVSHHAAFSDLLFLCGER